MEIKLFLLEALIVLLVLLDSLVNYWIATSLSLPRSIIVMIIPNMLLVIFGSIILEEIEELNS